MNDASQQFSELMKRQDIDTAVARYQEMYARLRSALAATFTGMTWTQSLEPTGAACGSEFAAIDADQPQDDAVSTTLGNWDSTTSIPDARWPTALAVVTGVARQYDFTEPQVMVNRPAAHFAQFEDSQQAVLTFGLGNALGLTLVTGCHLTAAAKQRGHPAPAPAPTYPIQPTG
jgi:hypothetical protein